jgi:hypothetical protein
MRSPCTLTSQAIGAFRETEAALRRGEHALAIAALPARNEKLPRHASFCRTNASRRLRWTRRTGRFCCEARIVPNDGTPTRSLQHSPLRRGLLRLQHFLSYSNCAGPSACRATPVLDRMPPFWEVGLSHAGGGERSVFTS